jgi:sec-independent protein translocase protein TatC
VSDDPRITGEMTFLEHLDELRKVLVQAAAACLAGALAGWWLAPRVLEDIIRRTVKEAVVLSPLEAFNERFKLALLLGLFISLPIVLHRIWSFVVPGSSSASARGSCRWCSPRSACSRSARGPPTGTWCRS